MKDPILTVDPEEGLIQYEQQLRFWVTSVKKNIKIGVKNITGIMAGIRAVVMLAGHI